MPNWCECDLIITGKEKELKAFVEFAKGEEEDNNEREAIMTTKFVPYPKEHADIQKEIEDWHKANPGKTEWDGPKDWFNRGGRDWCIKNWGTKWGICHSELVEEDYKYEEITYAFDSAWSPPEPIILAMSKKFPELTFRMTYFEQGCQFNGIYECKAGEVLNEETGKYWGNRGG